MRQGFETYLPRYLKMRRHARFADVAPVPMFPRYLFVAIDMAVQRWRSIQSTSGVSRLICSGEVPAEAPSDVIEHLKSLEDERGFVRLSMKPAFRAGDPIRVIDGVFSSCLGLFEGMTDGERVAVLLDLLGRKVRVVIGANFIAAA
jgi:transcriptional antiterminator RfaH